MPARLFRSEPRLLLADGRCISSRWGFPKIRAKGDYSILGFIFDPRILGNDQIFQKLFAQTKSMVTKYRCGRQIGYVVAASGSTGQVIPTLETKERKAGKSHISRPTCLARDPFTMPRKLYHIYIYAYACSRSPVCGLSPEPQNSKSKTNPSNPNHESASSEKLLTPVWPKMPLLGACQQPSGRG